MSLPITPPSFVNECLTKSWSAEGNGPQEFNCYNLVRHVYRTQFMIDLPEVMVSATEYRKVIKAIKESSSGGTWLPVTKPSHGDVVVFSPSSEPLHIGVWLCYDGGIVLHACRRLNVSAADILRLKAMGFNNPEFYRYVGTGQ